MIDILSTTSLISERERNLSESDVKDMFMKYISVLTDEHVVIDYFNVENGG